jgi:cytochrome aa3-600 menaquinol oxidase subunit 4
MIPSDEWRVETPEEHEEREPGLSFLEPKFTQEEFPWRQVGGYSVSLLLTGLGIWLVLRGRLGPEMLLALILTLAGIQGLVQLGAFMHIRESRGAAWHIVPLGLVLGMGIGIVITAVWIMAFKWGVS